MHTALCTFDEKARAEQAVDNLVTAGFPRHDVHIEHKQLSAEADANDRFDGMEREVALGRNVVAAFGNFFSRLFGRNDEPHVDTYGRHVERGGYVVVVDTSEPGEAERARRMLSDWQAGDLNVVHRPQQPPLREIVANRQGTATTDDKPL
ncbi:MAG TPA: hypothetical protein VFB71_07985 [Ramlibacter sp.]|nr:hypothetical protein [Ramlibacter sp.]